MQILKDVVLASSTHTEEESCFTPRFSCFADTSTVGTDLNFFYQNINGNDNNEIRFREL